MRVKVILDRMSDVQEFVKICSAINEPVHLTNGENYTVSAKSVMGVLYSYEWNEIYCTCEKDIYEKIKKFVVE